MYAKIDLSAKRINWSRATDEQINVIRLLALRVSNGDVARRAKRALRARGRGDLLALA